MADPIVLAAIGSAVIALVGSLMGTIGYMARLRVDKRSNGNGAASKRDLGDMNKEMCAFHNRLERVIAAQSMATTAMTLSLNTQTGLLNSIEKTLGRIEQQGR